MKKKATPIFAEDFVVSLSKDNFIAQQLLLSGGEFNPSLHAVSHLAHI